MQLFILLRGRSKSRLKPIMIDSKKKVENYHKALQSSDVKTWHYDIQPAPEGSKVWRQKRSTIGGNKPAVPRINRHGVTSVNGYIGKHGFQEHT